MDRQYIPAICPPHLVPYLCRPAPTPTFRAIRQPQDDTLCYKHQYPHRHAPPAWTSLEASVVDSLHTRARRIAAEARLVSVDVESHPGKGDQIFALGAVRSDKPDTFNSACSPGKAASVTNALDSFSLDGRVLLGHNLKRHDMPLLRKQLPQLSCLQWPVLDTLELSALAFPSNPYHRLVKGYKLISDERNNPTKDARVALNVFEDAVESLLLTHGHRRNGPIACVTTRCSNEPPTFPGPSPIAGRSARLLKISLMRTDTPR